MKEEQKFLEIMLLVGLLYVAPILILVIVMIRHRRKYWDKENKKIKCGDCGKWEWTMYYNDKGFFRTWRCGECSTKRYFEEQSKKEIEIDK